MKGKWAAAILAGWLFGIAVCVFLSAGTVVMLDALLYLGVTVALAFKAGRRSGS